MNAPQGLVWGIQPQGHFACCPGIGALVPLIRLLLPWPEAILTLKSHPFSIESHPQLPTVETQQASLEVFAPRIPDPSLSFRYFPSHRFKSNQRLFHFSCPFSVSSLPGFFLPEDASFLTCTPRTCLIIPASFKVPVKRCLIRKPLLITARLSPPPNKLEAISSSETSTPHFIFYGTHLFQSGIVIY